MNILLIPNNDWINHPVPSQRHYRIFERLGRKHRVYVIHFDIFRGNKKPTHVPEFTRVVRPFTINVSDPALFYMANLMSQSKRILSTIEDENIEIVFGSNLAVCTVGFKLGRIYGTKNMFDLSDFFPASASAYYPDSSRLNSTLIYSLSKLIMDYNIRKADICTTCSISLKEYAMRIGTNTRVEHLPNGVDTKTFLPRPPNERLRRDFELGDKVLIYVGSLESWLDFDVLLEAISILKQDGVQIQLLIVGRGIYSQNGSSLVQKVAARRLEQQVKFLGYQPYEKLPEFINASIGGIVPFKMDSVLTQMAFPNKMLEYLACGKPVFAPPMKELKNVCGDYLLPYNGPKSLAMQMKKAIASDYDPEEVRTHAINYDWDIISDRLEALMQGLLDS